MEMMHGEHWVADGRGERAVYLNGVKVARCIYADTERGIVRFHDDPPQIGPDDTIVEHELHGTVAVYPSNSAQTWARVNAEKLAMERTMAVIDRARAALAEPLRGPRALGVSLITRRERSLRFMAAHEARGGRWS